MQTWDFELTPVPGGNQVRALVLSGYGLNCEGETAAAFRMAGAQAEISHTGAVLEAGATALDGVQCLAFCGGFSFGDHIASGRVLANRLRYRMADALARFVDNGGHVIGICNGFQTIVKLGLLPAFGRQIGDPLAVQQASLVHNRRLGYYDGWVRLAIDPASPCVFTRGARHLLLEAPSRHGEGQLVFADAAMKTQVEAAHLIPLRYADAQGRPTEAWPENPNGSEGGMAALCDQTGRVFGLMPHPEAFLYRENHPDWRAYPLGMNAGQGLGIFINAVRSVLAG